MGIKYSTKSKTSLKTGTIINTNIPNTNSFLYDNKNNYTYVSKQTKHNSFQNTEADKEEADLDTSTNLFGKNDDDAFDDGAFSDIYSNSNEISNKDISIDNKNEFEKQINNLQFKPDDIVQGIIYSEIFGKPRALSPFRRRFR